MPDARKRPLLPWWGYLLLNAAAAGFLWLVYRGAVAEAVATKTASVGLFPILATCWLAFAFVSVFDAAYDRLSIDEPQPGDAPDDGDAEPRDSAG